MNDTKGNALLVAYFSLLKALHSRGVLPISDVCNELGDSVDFRKSKKMDSDANTQAIQELYQAVLQIEKALPDFRPQSEQ